MRTPARSTIFCTRLRTLQRYPTSTRRWRLRARNWRNGSGGTWEGAQSPNWHTQASHTLSATSVLRPFNCFTCRACTRIASIPAASSAAKGACQ